MSDAQQQLDFQKLASSTLVDAFLKDLSNTVTGVAKILGASGASSAAPDKPTWTIQITCASGEKRSWTADRDCVLRRIVGASNGSQTIAKSTQTGNEPNTAGTYARANILYCLGAAAGFLYNIETWVDFALGEKLFLNNQSASNQAFNFIFTDK